MIGDFLLSLALVVPCLLLFAMFDPSLFLALDRAITHFNT